jgi:WD40 repeat protein
MSAVEKYIDKPPREYISQVKFSNTSHDFAVSSWDGTLSIYGGDCHDLKLCIESPVPLMSIAFSANDSLIFGGGLDGLIYVFDLHSQQIFTVGQHDEAIVSVCFNKSTDSIYTADESGVIKQWSCQTAKTIALLASISTASTIITMNTIENTLIAAIQDNTFKLFDPQDLEKEPEVRPSALAHQTRSLVCHPSLPVFIYGSVEGRTAVEPLEHKDMVRIYLADVSMMMWGTCYIICLINYRFLLFCFIGSEV